MFTYLKILEIAAFLSLQYIIGRCYERPWELFLNNFQDAVDINNEILIKKKSNLEYNKNFFNPENLIRAQE